MAGTYASGPTPSHAPPPLHLNHHHHRHSQRSPALDKPDFSTFDDINIDDSPIRPPPSAFTAAATAYDPHSESPSPLENYSPASTAAHQRSLTGAFLNNCQPFLNRATSTLQQHTSRASLHSPSKSLASFIPSRGTLESTASQPKIRAGAKALQNWFNGSSAPISLGLAHRDESDDESGDDSSDEYDSDNDDDTNDEPTMISGIFNRGASLTSSHDTPDTTPKPQPRSPSTPKQTSASTPSTRFAWLLSTQKPTSTSPNPPPTTHTPNDPLLTLPIPQSLFPHGPLDPLSPSSFHDLLSAAESLLTRYQTAYRTLSSTLHDTLAEHSARDDELSESETRVRHLKMQLETLGARASAQDAEIARLGAELERERAMRREEEVARKRSVGIVRAGSLGQGEREKERQKEQGRRNRVSNSDISIDSGFESECEGDGESEAASIFSQRECASPMSTSTRASSAVSMAEKTRSGIAHHTPDTTPKSHKPFPLKRHSTYDRVRDGSFDSDISSSRHSWGCANCEGGSQASVWGRLAREREESGVLRRRVAELEDAVEGALNVVEGPWGL